MKHLKAQSIASKYNLLKNELTGLYYIERVKDNKTALIGDKDKAENYIIYGIIENKTELKTLKFI